MFIVVDLVDAPVELLLIMNELRNTNEIGADDMSNTRGLLLNLGDVQPHHPLTWSDARDALPPPALGSWYQRAAVSSVPMPGEPHHAILSDPLRRFLQTRLEDLSACMTTTPEPGTPSPTAYRIQFQSELARRVNTAKASMDSILWSHLDRLSAEHQTSAWFAETCHPDDPWSQSARFAIPRLLPLFADVYAELMRYSLNVDLPRYFRRTKSEPQKQGDWVSNNPGDIRKFWPRREGVQYFASIPMPTPYYTTNALLSQGLSGIYLAEDAEGYFAREQVNPTNPFDKYKK